MSRKLVIAATIACIFLLCLSLLLLIAISPILHTILIHQFRLSEDTLLFEAWVKPAVPIYVQFYFFELLNPVEFQNGSKPQVKQRGPYTYRERRFKTNITRDESRATVSYREVKQYFFDSELSVGLETDSLITTNLAYLAIAQQIDGFPAVIVALIEAIEKYFGDQLITNRTIGELVWGYEDPFLARLKSLHIVPSALVGIYLNKNDTDDGIVVIDTGLNDSTKLGLIRNYAGSTAMSCWSTPTANMINGSDGSLFHPFAKRDEDYYVFAPDLCRSIQFEVVENVRVHGISTLKLLPLEDTFDSPLISEKNRGFCPKWPNCLKSGVLDMSTCQPGAPIVMSSPHLVAADKSYQDAVEGLHPSDEFNTTFYVEPTTGIILNAVKKLQINAVVKQNDKLTGLRWVKDVFLPIVYVNESVTVDALTAGKLNSLLIVPTAIKFVSLSLAVLSAVALCTMGLIALYRYRRANQNVDYEPLTPPDTATVPDLPTVDA